MLIRKLSFVVAVLALAASVVFGGEKKADVLSVPMRVASDGMLEFPGGKLSVSAFFPRWKGADMVADWSALFSESRKMKIRNRSGKVLFVVSSEWAVSSPAEVRGRVEMECVAPAEMQCLSLAAVCPKKPPHGGRSGTSAKYTLPLENGRSLTLMFNEPISYCTIDSRKWGGVWTTRFGESAMKRRKYEPGDRLVWDVSLSAKDGIAFSVSKPLTIAEGGDWMRFDYKKDIEPGSALDFSGLGLQDAPAGKYGWLKSNGGQFEFEGRPGVGQRFYGANLCFAANYLKRKMADRLVDRFVRCGYNAVRIHHHDNIWAKDGKTAHKRLDYLLAKCYAAGIYATTDFYVSRSVKWRDIGIDREGEMPKHLYKTYVGIHEPAFTNWCHWTRAFLEHVNPYTGRAYKDEPGMPFISLINEGNLAMGWQDSGKADDPIIMRAWKEFGGKGPVPKPNYSDPDDPHNRFDRWINRRVWERCTAFVRSLGCKALLSNDNNGRWQGEGDGITPLLDYVDCHSYVDHPKFLEEKWKLPSHCSQKNPILNGQPALMHRGYAKGASSPYTITEWNFAGPSRYRGMGGILMGAMASEQEWDGLWRFAYSHSDRNLLDGRGSPAYFDCVSDPVIAASDRASVCLYLRGDAAADSLKVDKDRGSMTLVSPRTCGGFAESGRIEAGPLAFEIIGDIPTTVWASSLDSNPIACSSRILLTHLTDIQGEGQQFADDSMCVLLKRGGRPLIRRGNAEVTLRIDSCGKSVSGSPHCAVYWIDTSGCRRGDVPFMVRNGAIVFNVSTDCPDGGRICYEVVRE